MNFKVVAIECGIRKLLHKIAQNGELGGVVELQMQQNMPMSEEVIVDVGSGVFVLFGKKHKRLVVFPFVVAFVVVEVFFAVALRPFIAEIQTYHRWYQCTKQPLAGFAVKNGSYQRKSSAFVVQPIAVSQKKTLAVNAERSRASVYFQPDFVFQIAKRPHIVVARKIVHFDACICQFGHFAQ